MFVADMKISLAVITRGEAAVFDTINIDKAGEPLSIAHSNIVIE